MNYRHAYHAGNAADCLKHALLVWLLHALRRKPAGFTVLDTHAGIGVYDLAGEAAIATGEWQHGIGRLRADPPAALADYLALAGDAGRYPGSPSLCRALLRPQDRLVCCELHDEDSARLRRLFANDAQVAVHRRDGYAALGALLPPTTARGLVLIDPPYEQEDEAEKLVDAIVTARARFATGVVAAWFPIKHLAPVRSLRLAVTVSVPDVVAASLWLRPPHDPRRLNGSGLLVANPPFGFEAAAEAILAALQARLGEDGAGYAVERWSDE